MSNEHNTTQAYTTGVFVALFITILLFFTTYNSVCAEELQSENYSITSQQIGTTHSSLIQSDNFILGTRHGGVSAITEIEDDDEDDDNDSDEGSQRGSKERRHAVSEERILIGGTTTPTTVFPILNQKQPFLGTAENEASVSNVGDVKRDIEQAEGELSSVNTIAEPKKGVKTLEASAITGFVRENYGWLGNLLQELSATLKGRILILLFILALLQFVRTKTAFGRKYRPF